LKHPMKYLMGIQEQEFYLSYNLLKQALSI